MNVIKSIGCHTLFGVCLFTLTVSGAALAGDAEPLLLLTNGNVLHGTIEVQGNFVVLHRVDGNQLRLRRDEVLHAATTIEELYRYRSQKRSFRNSSSHIDDAKWCLRHGLIQGAEAEVSELIALDPSHPEVSRLQRQIAAAKTPHAKAPLVLPITPPEVEVGRAESAPMPEGISPASIAAFASKVQPLLINRCGNAGCHRTGSDPSWQLSHLGVNVRVSARMTQRNLIAVLHQVNMEDPFSSQLLKYSKTAHGNGSYAPTAQTTQSIESTLRDWLSQLGRYPPPLVAQNAFSPAASGPLSSASMTPWPVVQAASSESASENYTIDKNGELIYHPRTESKNESTAAPAIEDLVPPSWPAPVIGPIQRTNLGKNIAPPKNLTLTPTLTPTIAPTIATDKSLNPVAGTVHPKRLPTIENPFSADLFNRQYQRASANTLPK